MHEMAVSRRLVAEALERIRDDGRDHVGDVEVVLGSAAGFSGGSLLTLDREELAYVRSVAAEVR